MARFVVDLGKVTLTPEQHAGIAHAIQSTVLAQLGTNKLDTSGSRLIARSGGPWAGMIMDEAAAGAHISAAEASAETFTKG